MSRAVKADYEFNKERFRDLLLQAKRWMSVVDFADKCGVSLAYMSKYLNCRFDKPPIPSTVHKIAEWTEEYGVSEAELLEAAGYEVKKYTTDDSYIKKLNEHIEKLKAARQKIDQERQKIDQEILIYEETISKLRKM